MSLLKKYKKAIPSWQEAKTSHEGLTESLETRLVEEWSQMEEKAMKERGDALTVFDVVEKKGMMLHSDIIATVIKYKTEHSSDPERNQVDPHIQ